MTSQPSIFDPQGAQEAKDAGIAAADAHSPSEFKRAARVAIERCAARGPFTADAVWRELEHMGAQMPYTPAALGPVMTKAAADGVIEQTGQQVQSVLARRHRRLTEWRATAREA